jgi:hypothetical protein
MPCQCHAKDSLILCSCQTRLILLIASRKIQTKRGLKVHLDSTDNSTFFTYSGIFANSIDYCPNLPKFHVTKISIFSANFPTPFSTPFSTSFDLQNAQRDGNGIRAHAALIFFALFLSFHIFHMPSADVLFRLLPPLFPLNL